jgi:hypothetical protein
MARTNRAEPTAADEGAAKPPVSQPAAVTANSDIARRAYELYLARGCRHGHDLEDWVQAERELKVS